MRKKCQNMCKNDTNTGQMSNPSSGHHKTRTEASSQQLTERKSINNDDKQSTGGIQVQTTRSQHLEIYIACCRRRESVSDHTSSGQSHGRTWRIGPEGRRRTTQKRGYSPISDVSFRAKSRTRRTNVRMRLRKSLVTGFKYRRQGYTHAMKKRNPRRAKSGVPLFSSITSALTAIPTCARNNDGD